MSDEDRGKIDPVDDVWMALTNRLEYIGEQSHLQILSTPCPPRQSTLPHGSFHSTDFCSNKDPGKAFLKEDPPRDVKPSEAEVV